MAVAPKPNEFDKVLALSPYKFTMIIIAVTLICCLSIWQKPETAVPMIFGAVLGGGIVASRKR